MKLDTYNFQIEKIDDLYKTIRI